METTVRTLEQVDNALATLEGQVGNLSRTEVTELRDEFDIEVLKLTPGTAEFEELQEEVLETTPSTAALAIRDARRTVERASAQLARARAVNFRLR